MHFFLKKTEDFSDSRDFPLLFRGCKKRKNTGEGRKKARQNALLSEKPEGRQPPPAGACDAHAMFSYCSALSCRAFF